jgi:FkbM family methyltransferase
MHDKALLTTHHVGGREGAGPFKLPKSLATDSPIVFYEADPDAVAGMKSEGRPTIAISKCVGKVAGRTEFNITSKPHASSVLRLNPRFFDAYVHKVNVEPIWSVTFRVIRTIEIETDSLDSMISSGQYPVNPPDVLTMDAEGAEYEILEGAEALLKREIVCVVSEVSFLPIREGQKLYGDISGLLSRKGFIPVQIKQHPSEMSFYRAPVGLRGRGIQVFADVVFLKDPESAVADWAGPDAAIKLRKLAIAAVTFGQLEYALDCLKRAREVGLPNLSAPPLYWTFLDALEERAASVPPRFLPVPGSIQLNRSTPGANVQRLGDTGGGGITTRGRIKNFLVGYPNIKSAIIRGLAFLIHARRRLVFLAHMRLGARTPIEKLLAQYGFVDLSEEVRLLRIQQSPWVVNVGRAPGGEVRAQ